MQGTVAQWTGTSGLITPADNSANLLVDVSGLRNGGILVVGQEVSFVAELLVTDGGQGRAVDVVVAGQGPPKMPLIDKSEC